MTPAPSPADAPAPPPRRWLRWLAGVLALACAMLAGYKWLAARDADVITLPAQRCDPAAERCTVALPGGGRLSFSATPAPLRPLRPFALAVTLDGATATRVEVEFAGVSMDMGRLRSTLAGGDGRFAGEAMLPVCVGGAMEWSATIRLGPPHPVAVPFHFTVAAN